MALSKKQKLQLEQILIDIEKTERFLMKDSTLIAIKTNITAFPIDTFLNKETNEKYVSFTKNAGSDLCYMNNAKTALKRFLETN